eukprot:CAMPEP_0206143764 /NCGR_PEP_ID=MMETSP1473-20131121/21729_1 /ASSEMBLY_ACC=CAM_ASM_001109 /TAXON_ID=1461547 /ORGANISM="Stichococcus sp, Strain RCC1054" /LENGTH=569 /DNA_ID=CAMNT_0053539315 /DNA_START=81 /DNA_END=1787 /DNA_ORIENTATION=-
MRDRSQKQGMRLTLIILILHAAVIGRAASEKDQYEKFFERASKASEPNEDVRDAGAGKAHPPLARVLARYYSNEELVAHLEDYVKRCSSISRLQTIGKSVGGQPLTVLILGHGARNADPQPKPAFRYVGNMHGDEPTGRQLLLGLAEWLCARKDQDFEAARMLESIELHLMPTANPDGFENHLRNNGNGRDLNRDFPEVLNQTSGERIPAPLPLRGSEQPETAAIMAWASSRSFVASASMHEGALVANFPWDANDHGEKGYAAAPDDAAFRFLAEAYAQAHAKMVQAPEFAATGGITNGAEWYEVHGSMQDWVYVDRQCMEVTLEVSERKWPHERTLADLFNDNLQALLALPFAAALAGASGFVYSTDMEPLVANISVTGVSTYVTSSPTFGDFYRPLAPGNYELVAEAEGYRSARGSIEVPADGIGVRHNFTLAVDSTHKPQPKSGSSDTTGRASRSAGQGLTTSLSTNKVPLLGISDTTVISASLSEQLTEEYVVNSTDGSSGPGPQVGHLDAAWSVGGSTVTGSRKELRGTQRGTDGTLTWLTAVVAAAVLVAWAVRRRARRRRMW